MRNGAWIALVAAVAACDRDGGQPPADGNEFDTRPVVVEVGAVPNREVDLLFVVDDSGSMSDKQAKLVAGIPQFISTLRGLPGGMPDLHLGVITPDMGTKSATQPPGASVGTVGQGGCAGTGKGGALQVNGAPVTGSFLADIGQTDGSRLRNYTGELADVVSMMVRTGTTGCGFEQPLHAMRAALDDHPANAGFVRPAAQLAVVFLSDEDDCSLKDTALLSATDAAALGPLTSFRCTRFGVTCAVGGATSDAMNQAGPKEQCGPSTSSMLLDDVSGYRDFLVDLKADPGRVIVAGILGATEPFAIEQRVIGGTDQMALVHSCMYQGEQGLEIADPAIRLEGLLRLFPGRSLFSTICQPDHTAALAGIAHLIAGTACLRSALADADAGTPGLQPDCLVEDRLGSAVTRIEPCDASDTPTCWKLEADPAGCPHFDHLKLVVARSSAPDPATITRMRCLVE